MSSLTYHPSQHPIPPSLQTITSPPSPITTPSRYTHFIRPILERDHPGSLHLTPSTLQQFLDCDYNNDRYELVDGLLVSTLQMAPPDPEHESLAHWLSFLVFHVPLEQRRKIHAYPERTLLLSSKTDANNHREERSIPQSPAQSSSSNLPAVASSSRDPRRRTETPSSSTQRDTCRIPDFYLVARDEGSEASDAPISPFERNLSRTPGWKKAILVGEITSCDRMKDLKTRLAEYEQEQIPEYIILDRHKLLKYRNPCVEVHKLQKHGRQKGKYTKRVYSGHEKVDCSFFKHWNLTANQMLDYKYLRDLVEHEKRTQEEGDRNAQKEREKAQKEQKRADRAEEEVRKERGKTQKEREKAQKEQKRADRAEEEVRKERGKTQKEREKAQKAQMRADRAEEENKKYEAHVRAFFKGERSTPPRGFELDESQFKIKSKTRSDRGEASKLPSSPALRMSPKSPASPVSQTSPKSPASQTSPKSPASPPHRVRRVDASDVKASSHKHEKNHRHGKKK